MAGGGAFVGLVGRSEGKAAVDGDADRAAGEEGRDLSELGAVRADLGGGDGDAEPLGLGRSVEAEREMGNKAPPR